MATTKLQYRSGVFTDNTQTSGEGGWYDCDKVRFRLGFPEQLGGWVNFLTGQSYLGVCRDLHQWTSLDFSQYISIGTHLKLYVEYGGDPYDITPIRRTVTLGSNPFSCSTGQTTLTVTDVANGAIANDFVTFSGATAFDNFTTAVLNKEYQIVSIVDPDHYVIDTGVAASGTTSGGGASVQAQYQINTGLIDYTTGFGWGAGPYSSGTYSGYYSGSTYQLRLWQCDNFGEDLVCTYRNGNLYYWQKSISVSASDTPNARAVVLSSVPGANNVPTIALGVAVSDSDRHVIAFGCDDYGSTGTQNLMLIRWSAQENILDWEPRADNTSGSLKLALGSTIIGFVKTRAEFPVWTDRAMYSFHFVGPPDYFAVNQISDSVSLIGPKACTEAAGVVYWMDSDQFYLYNGTINPIPCPILKTVFDNINVNQAFKVVACANSRMNEVWWQYPSAGSTENDSYVIYNYVENTWARGTLERTAWADLAYQGFPLACSTTKMYQHEVGFNDDTSAMSSFCESCDMDLDDGEHFTFSNQLIPDHKFFGTSGTPILTYVLKVRDYPGNSLITQASSDVGSGFSNVSVRLRGRQVVLRLQANGTQIGWRLGTPRLTTRPDGRK